MKSNVLRGLGCLNNTLRRDSFSNYLNLLRIVLRTTDAPFNLTALNLLDQKDFKGLYQLADSLVEQKSYSTVTDHFVASQFAALIRKYPWPDGSLGFDPKALAISTFDRSEHYCSLTNRRFLIYQRGRKSSKALPFSSLLDKSRNWIYRLLGTKVPLKSIYSHCSFGPGASVGVHGTTTNFARKLLAKRWSVSPGAFYYARSAMISNPHILEYLVKRHSRDIWGSRLTDHLDFYSRFSERCDIVKHNKIVFVPKTAKTFRTIAVEPLLDGFVQKGLDIVMRKRLARFGLNLNDQTINQELARQGSLPGQSDPFVTIDLTSASDSISTEFVRYIVPPDWFDFMNSIRSRYYSLDGVVKPYQKFVSMGNGFCFPLETLIFGSLCAAVYDELDLKHDFSVYGDDIIVRSSAATRLISLLKVCGFRVNLSKTFLQGPFRESCGTDWFEGKDVRPVTLDYTLDSFQCLAKFYNITRSKIRSAAYLHEGLDFVKSLVPKRLLLCRPYKGVIDSAFEIPFDAFLSSPFSRFDRKIWAWSWVELVATSIPDKGVRGLEGYNLALTMAALRGSPSQCPFAERRNSRTKVRRLAYSGATSSWFPAYPA